MYNSPRSGRGKALESSDYEGWEKLDRLGKGGQGEVFLARSPARVKKRQEWVEAMEIAWQFVRPVRGIPTPERPMPPDFANNFAMLSYEYARPETDSELGALKLYNIGQPDDDEIPQAIKRFEIEVEALNTLKFEPGILKLLAYSKDEFWIVTEYMPQGSLERLKNREPYIGEALLSLKAFRTVVATVKLLHDRKWVHRDIKPANVFVRKIDELVLGDMGIVFVPEAQQRVTELKERVGPRDYMAPWLNRGRRVDVVNPSSDVYMLGKLLWCMVSGRVMLPYEDHRRPDDDLTKMFPADLTTMERINLILDQCVVREEHLCLKSAGELLTLVDKTIEGLEGDSRILPDGRLNRTCLMCGKGKYQPKVDYLKQTLHFHIRLDDPQNMPRSDAIVEVHVCDVCTHHAFFAIGQPEGHEKLGWSS
jgi:serine/threonine protein kinase